jgi:hypothetical protein
VNNSAMTVRGNSIKYHGNRPHRQRAVAVLGRYFLALKPFAL